jgi:hypothetical protein
MSETTKALLARIDAFIAESGMTERRFGIAVSNNHKLIPRLRAGFGINSNTQDRINAFLAGRELPPLVPRRAKQDDAQAAA